MDEWMDGRTDGWILNRTFESKQTTTTKKKERKKANFTCDLFVFEINKLKVAKSVVNIHIHIKQHNTQTSTFGLTLFIKMKKYFFFQPKKKLNK